MDKKSRYIITEAKTFISTLYDGVVVLGIFVFFGFFLRVVFELSSRTLWIVGAAIGLLVTATFTYKYQRSLKQLSFRQEALMAHALSNGYKYEYSASGDVTKFTSGAIYGLGEREKNFQNFVGSKEWSYVEYSYGVYSSSSGNFQYRDRTSYYSIMYVELPRILPNVFFDSKSATKQQFKLLFDQKQLHSLEGNFDKYFATYFPEDYTIDGLSFITPEVMETLIEAADYDIEICGNRLYLYGRLMEPVYQLADMETKINRIKDKLLNNIVTYRDQRIAYEDGRKTVSLSAQKLRRPRSLPAIVTVVVIAIWLIIQLRFRGD